MKRSRWFLAALALIFMITACPLTYTSAAEHDEVPSDGVAEEDGQNGDETGEEGDIPAEDGDEAGQMNDMSDVTVDIGDGRLVTGTYPDDLIPNLFHKENLDLRGTGVECIKFDNGDITLVYTKDASSSDGIPMLYDPVKDAFSDVRIIRGVDDRYIIVLADCDGDIPPGYTKAVLDWNGQTLTAFMEESVAQGSAPQVNGVDPADFFLVYAMSSEGNKGWYRYDKNELTYQRYLASSAITEADPVAATSDTEDEAEGILDEYIPRDIQGILLLVCAPLALILLAVTVILAVKVHEYAADYEYYEDDMYEEEEDDEEYVRKTAKKKNGLTAASLVGKSLGHDDEDDEDEEDDEDDEDEDEDDEDEDEDDADADADDDDEEDDDDEDEEDDDEDDEDTDADDAGEDDDEEEDDDEDDEEDEDEDDVRPAHPRVKRVKAQKASPDEEDDVSIYTKPLTRRERRELEREEKWRQKEEKKAAKRREQGYEEATPMDWSKFETGSMDLKSENAYKNVAPPKYMTESMEKITEEDLKEEPVRKKKLPPRKISAPPEEDPKPQVVQEEEMRQKQRRLFEQQQRIEEQRRIEAEQEEEKRRREQQQFISTRFDEDDDLDEDFQFEFLKLD